MILDTARSLWIEHKINWPTEKVDASGGRRLTDWLPE